MPFTPFHFGLGLATKAVFPRRFSLAVFVALQVVIDLESLYNLVKHRYPVHRFLHTFVGATILAFAAALVLLPVVVSWTSKKQRSRLRLFAGLLTTALFATWSHVVLDGIMHADARPFWPFTESNPLLSLVRLGVLHMGLVVLGILGLIGIAFSLLSDEELRVD